MDTPSNHWILPRTRLRRDAKSPTFASLDHSSKLNERRYALLKRIKQFRALQALYSPASIRAQVAADDARDSSLPPQDPEDIALWLPSELLPSQRERGCVDGLAMIECRLAECRALTALHEACAKLNTKSQLLRFRKGNLVGQSGFTKSNMLLQRLAAEVDFEGAKYNENRAAVLALGGEFALPKLEPDDLRSNTVISSDSSSARRINVVTSTAEGVVPVLNRQTTVSWIWTARGGALGDEPALHSCELSVLLAGHILLLMITKALRVEWLRASARLFRWNEEVQLLREEMRRVLRFLTSRSDWWLKKASEYGEGRVGQGKKAYAMKQASIASEIRANCLKGWTGPVKVGRDLKAREDKMLPEGAIVLEEQEYESEVE